MYRDQYLFDSKHDLGALLPERFTEDQVRHEPMLFSADMSFAIKHGGPLTEAFLLAIARDRPSVMFQNLVIDTKVTMLMTGWYPCIPGWHQDDVPRTSPDGQPNYDTPEYHAQHVMALQGPGNCQTEFVSGKVTLPGVPAGEVISKAWHPEIEAAITRGELTVSAIDSGQLVWFDAHSIHRGTAATAPGWRWFGRASWNTDRPIRNELRQQVQVYLPGDTLNAGW